MGIRVKGFPKIRGTFWEPYNEDYSILGSKLGSAYFGKVPFSFGLGTLRVWNLGLRV